MAEATDELFKLTEEVKELSARIASMKRESNQMADGLEKEQLIKEIKTKQHQALFYIEKMENLSKE